MILLINEEVSSQEPPTNLISVAPPPAPPHTPDLAGFAIPPPLNS